MKTPNNSPASHFNELEPPTEQLPVRLRRGVVAWKEKLAIAKQVLNVVSLAELIAKVHPAKSQKEIDAIADSARRWHQHTPLLHRDFFEALGCALECASGVNGTDIILSTLDEFIALLPPQHQARVRQMAVLDSMPSGTRPAAFGGRNMRWNVRGQFESLSSGVRAGHLDTRHYYSNADAATAWSELVSADAYPTYDQCKAGLLRLTEDPQWQAALTAARPTALVMLAGGGSPTKDLVLLRSLLLQSRDSKHKITLVLADNAPYMLHYSMEILERAVRELPGHERVILDPVVEDVLTLGREPLFSRKGNAVFTIAGGTIGNLRELTFFRSLAVVARAGDLLVVSADTVDDMSAEEMEQVLTKKYDHAQVRRFIEPGVRAVLGEFKSREPIDAVLERVTVRVISNATPRLSDVPESTCVTLVLRHGRRDVILASSTRYSVDAFIEFAAQHGWTRVCVVASPLNPHFVQMCFKRNAAEHTGTP